MPKHILIATAELTLRLFRAVEQLLRKLAETHSVACLKENGIARVQLCKQCICQLVSFICAVAVHRADIFTPAESAMYRASAPYVYSVSISMPSNALPTLR